MVAAFSQACGGPPCSARAVGQHALSLSLPFDPPASPALVAFVAGFVKGAATRLNEGVVPGLRPGAQGPREFSLTLAWAPAPASGALTGGKRTRRTQ